MNFYTKYLTVSFFLFLPVLLQAQPQDLYTCHGRMSAMHNIVLTEEETAFLIASQERSDTIDILDYDILADLTRGVEGVFRGKTKVTFTSKLDSIDYINLDLLDLTVDSIIGQNGNKLEFNHTGFNLRVELDDTLSQNDIYELIVFYQGIPYSDNTTNFGGFYFSDRYYYNLGIGINDSPHNMGRAWYPCFDNFVERSTYTYRIRTLKDRKGYGLGTFKKEEEIDSNTIERTYRLEMEIPTYLSHIAAADYVTIDYEHKGQYGVIPIELVTLAETKSKVRDHFKSLTDAIDCLEEWFGPYVWERVGYHMTLNGAMEHPTGVAYPIGTVINGDNLSLITHELGHHWWGNITTLTTEYDMWIKEGPATFSEHLLVEWLEGKKAYENVTRNNNMNVLRNAHIRDGDYLVLSPMPDAHTYGMHTYDKGAAMMHNLRAYIGDDALFKSTLQYVLEEKKFSHMDAEKFKSLLEKGADMSLHNYFTDWIYSPGWSDFYIKDYIVTGEKGNYNVKVHINQNSLHANRNHNGVPLNIHMYHSDGTKTIRRFYVAGDESIAFLEVDKIPVAVHVNTENSINLAQVSDELEFSSNGIQQINYGGMGIQNISYKPNDGSFVVLTHHLTNAEGKVKENIEVLGKNHFWHYSNPLGLDNISAKIDFDGTPDKKNSLDKEIADDDTKVLLLYKAIGESVFKEAENYNLVNFSSNDYKGYFIIKNPKEGQYVLAKGEKSVNVNESSIFPELSIYPNPTSDNLHVVNKENMEKCHIATVDGKIIHSYDLIKGLNVLDINDLAPSTYVMIFEDQSGFVHSESIVVQ